MQAWDRYAFVNNNPVRYTDPTGHWVETALDIAFIAFDLYQINQEGWTLVNTVALVADVAYAIVPIGTGGGPAVRAAMAGGDAVLTYAQAAAQVPDVVRVGQTAEKLLQLIEGSPPNSESSLSTSNGGNSPGPALNNSGEPYPTIIDSRTNQPIQEPQGNLKWVPPEQRVSWDSRYDRAAFIKTWHDQGFQTPNGGWGLYDIHHIIPLEYGGTNAFENLVPVLREVHQQKLNPWWFNYK